MDEVKLGTRKTTTLLHQKNWHLTIISTLIRWFFCSVFTNLSQPRILL